MFMKQRPVYTVQNVSDWLLQLRWAEKLGSVPREGKAGQCTRGCIMATSNQGSEWEKRVNRAHRSARDTRAVIDSPVEVAMHATCKKQWCPRQGTPHHRHVIFSEREKQCGVVSVNFPDWLAIHSSSGAKS